jgi:tetratricopeptide (TPR) repeat protein
MRALQDLGREIGGTNRGAQDRALARARETVQGPDAHHGLAVYMLAMARQRNDDALRTEALDALIASELTPKEKLAGFLEMRGGIAFDAGDFDTAKALWTRVVAMRPNDADALNNLAQVQARTNDAGAAAELLERAIAARQAAGQPVTEDWYQQRLSIANQSGSAEAVVATGVALIAAYPTPQNQRIALVLYRQLAAPQGTMEIDLMRMMRTMGTLSRSDEYQRMAQLLGQAGLGAEAKAVLDEGLARGLLDASAPPIPDIIAEIDREVRREQRRMQGATPSAALADSLVGAGRYAKAVELYRVAMGEGGTNQAEIEAHLGWALVVAGARMEAQDVFQGVAADAGAEPGSTSYADLAKFWLAWLTPASSSASAPDSQ